MKDRLKVLLKNVDVCVKIIIKEKESYQFENVGYDRVPERRLPERGCGEESKREK